MDGVLPARSGSSDTTEDDMAADDGEHGESAGARDARGRPSWVTAVVIAVLAAVVAVLGTLALTRSGGEEPGASPSRSPGAPTEPATDPGGPVPDGAVPDWVALAERVGPSVVAIDVRRANGAGEGSGVIVNAEGRIVTNHHVVAGAVELVVTLWDGRLYPATMVGTDAATDLAVIVIDDPPEDLRSAELGDSDEVRVGQAVAAIGNPLGLSNTMTTGVVSALDRPVTTVEQARLPGQAAVQVTTNAIQVDAAINPGNSGGPLFDSGGRVIGINSSIATMPSGAGGPSGSIGLGFAIPSNLVTLITEQLAADGVAEHAYLGVALTDAVVADDGARRAGAQVVTVEPGSPAADAGLQPGAVITAIDGRPVSGADSLVGFVRQYASGSEATLTVADDAGLSEVTVTLATREDVLP
ncbi:S1C family serine protease [Georgenia sp. H159]|uniref:S1C family serine protease n=1 Tax=Georgenia sp. H159 TaxID=3076115 RepID=UPI002D76B98D|nr:trypsin-like peptidase domain-containing protein [Georgenia sp. H159]